ncbi:MAG: DUF134 domain-containing protein [archaeon]|nr:DUF134 domain-containing protein [archaeon]
MPRPRIRRKVSVEPDVVYFKPAGVPMRTLEEVTLKIEEVEALHLANLEGLSQIKCAEKMNISQPTFHRTLESANKKISDALVNGKAIRIEGGTFEVEKE